MTGFFCMCSLYIVRDKNHALSTLLAAGHFCTYPAGVDVYKCNWACCFLVGDTDHCSSTTLPLR
jgi:hypothetical protein